MDIRVSRGDLLAAVKHATPRLGLPVALHATEESVAVHATTPNGDVLVTLPAATSGTGVAAVYPARLAAVLAACDGDHARIASHGATVEVSVESSATDWTMFTLPAVDAGMLGPPPDPVGGSDHVVLGADALRAVARVVHAASRDESRPLLAAVKLTAGGGRVRAVATDSYRLAACECGGVGELSVVVPAHEMRAALRRAEAAGELIVAAQGGRIMLATDTMIVRARGLAGVERYPDDQRLFRDAAGDNGATLGGVDVLRRLLAAVRHVGAAGDGPVRISTAPDQNRLRVSQRGSDGTTAVEHVTVDPPAVIPEIGVNGAFLADALNSMLLGASDASITVTTPTRPLLLAATGETSVFTGLLMPIRIG